MTSQLKLPYFGGTSVRHFTEDQETIANAQQALDAFLTKQDHERLADSLHVFAYYQDTLEAVGAEWAHAEMERIPQTATEIWQHVTPLSIEVQTESDELNTPFVVLEANCKWELEHGLLMSWRNGTDLWKVSSYDGHPVHHSVRSKRPDMRIIYQASNPNLTTFTED